MTPSAVSVHLLKALCKAVEELTPDQIDCDHEMLVIGIARMLANMLEQYPRKAQTILVPEILETIVSKIEGGQLLVVRKQLPTEH